MDQIFRKAHEILDLGYFGETEEAVRETHKLINEMKRWTKNLYPPNDYLEDLNKFKLNLIQCFLEAKITVDNDLIDNIMRIFQDFIIDKVLCRFFGINLTHINIEDLEQDNLWRILIERLKEVIE
ncbi:MAG: hypothetical protein PHW73_10390 [Atribacterota bacterium]|nr:hypothetical protein [Atribacterota bacterium]